MYFFCTFIINQWPIFSCVASNYLVELQYVCKCCCIVCVFYHSYVVSNQTEPQPLWSQTFSMVQTVSQARFYTTKLQEYCRSFQLIDPVYTVVPAQSGSGFYSTVTIAGRSYIGALGLNEEEARKSATAEVAMQLLRLSE